MNKSYTELYLEQGRHWAKDSSIVPWPVRIAEARKRGEFTEEDNDAAGDWVTCACGHQDAGIPRNPIGCPLDKELDDLGMHFYSAVCDNNFDKAEDILVSIQRRAVEVLSNFWK